MWVGKKNSETEVEWRPETEDWLKYAKRKEEKNGK